MSKLIKEVNEIIAVRVPPGDRWTLRTDSRKDIVPEPPKGFNIYGDPI